MELFNQVMTGAAGTWIAGIIAAVGMYLLSRLDVAKIPINPWKWMRRKVGEFFGAENKNHLEKLDERLDQLETLLKKHIADSDRRDADKSRRRILSFERELQWDEKHSEEDFKDIMLTIKQYNEYCEKHPEYENNITVESASHIKEVYRERIRNHDFLQGGHSHD